MALKLGELVAYLGLDDGKFEEGLGKAKTKFQGFADRMGPAAAVAGGAAAAALAAGLAGGLEFDAAQAKLTAQLGSAEYAQDLGTVAGNLYSRGFAETVGEAMDNVRAVMKSGLLPEDTDSAVIEDITRKAQALATTFDVDVTEASRAAGQMVRNGLAKNASQAFDIITRGFQKTGDQAGDYLDTLSEYSVQFRKLGLDGTAATGLLAQGLKAGARDVDTVADGIKEFSIRAVDGSTSSAAGFKALGLNAKKMTAQIAAGGTGASAGLDTVLDRLRAMKDPVKQQAAAVALFGTKAEDMGAALFALDPTSAVDAMGQVNGAAGKMADTLEQSASQQLEAFKRQVQQALVQEVSKAVPTLKEIAGWLKANQEVVVPLAQVLGILAIAIAGIVAAVKVWTAVQTALNVVMALNPIGLLILGIALIIAGIALLWTQVDGFRQFWIDAWDSITGAASAAWSWVKKNWPLLLAILTGPVGLAVRYIVQHWNQIKSGATAVKDWIVAKWHSMIDFFTRLPGKLRSAARGMWDGIKDAFKSALNWLISKWNNLRFSIPGLSVPGLGQVWGGASLGTPDIPYLASGGNITTAGIARVGERGMEDVYLPEGASVHPLRPGQTSSSGGSRQEVVHRVVLQYPNGEIIREMVFDSAAGRGQSPSEFLKVG